MNTAVFGLVDENTIQVQSEPLTGFEGPEKRLEVDFKWNPNSLNGLREISKEKWQELLNYAKCTIISHTPNDYFDAYVLSESSLFVYPFKMMVKTCGTTTLLNVIPKLIEYAQELNLEIEFVMFSRKNYMFPTKQMGPHSYWEDEVNHLNNYFDGNSYIIGNQATDHWYLYLADYSQSTRVVTPEKTLEIMMHKLDSAAAAQFYRKEGQGDKDKFPGIAELIPDCETDEFNFTPCGYSMNGLYKQAYSTIHVTPEPHCSYASFETNLSSTCYNALINQVLSIFKPATFSVTFFTEKGPNAVTSIPFTVEMEGYVVKHKTVSELEGNCDVIMVNYETIEYNSRPKPPKKIKVPGHLLGSTQVIY